MNQLFIRSVGTYHTSQVYPYEAGRQTDTYSAEGQIELHSGENFEQALTGIEGCQRLWLIFGFHQNESWKPMVRPPRGPKMGVFATRSPYRPNPLGISCVELIERKGLILRILGADLLDQTPIYDIKPYLDYADSFPGILPEWLQDSVCFEISFSPLSESQLSFLESEGVNQIEAFICHQLEFEPTNSKKKRVRVNGMTCTLSYRTWRIDFEISKNQILILSLYSGYSDSDLEASSDTYQDKNLHRKFKKLFQ